MLFRSRFNDDIKSKILIKLILVYLYPKNNVKYFNL